MANVTINKIKSVINRSSAAYGDLSVLQFPLVCGSSGELSNSDQSTAVQTGDVLRLGILPAGTTLFECLSIISDVAQAAATVKLGFAYVDGVDAAAPNAQDDDYFSASIDMATQDRLYADNNTVIPLTLPKDAYLIATWAGAHNDEASRADVLIFCKCQGTK